MVAIVFIRCDIVSILTGVATIGSIAIILFVSMVLNIELLVAIFFVRCDIISV